MLQKIIIIGATSGIGREMALYYLSKGCTVGITGRRQPLLLELKQLHPQLVFTSCFDVCDEKGPYFLSKLMDEMEGMDLLIYNAGFGEASKTFNPNTELLTTQTNVLGCVRLVAFSFDYFLHKGRGQIALISSIAALRGNSWAPAYSASKAFISNYAEGLNLKASKLRIPVVVTDVKPGFLATKKAIENKTFWVAQPGKAAQQIVKAIDNKKRKVYVTKRWWVIAQLMKAIPFWVLKKLG